jgi:hypothetical protein
MAASIPSVDDAACAKAKEKHISFHTFVERCIVIIEKPKRKYSCAILYSDGIYDQG